MRQLRLREVLDELGVTQGQLSRGANVALQTVSRMCNNPNYVPNADTLFKIADYLKVPVEKIYVEITPSQPNEPDGD